MLTLYYSPGSCSLAVHIALREAALDHSLKRVATRAGEHLKSEYAAVNPLCRIPSLICEDGSILTEVPALLWYVAALAPSRQLLPSGGPGTWRAVEWLSLLTSAVHPPFSIFFNPARWIDDPKLHSDVQKHCHQHFWQMLQHVEGRLDAEWVMGAQFTLCDPYAAVFYWWGLRTGLPVSELERYSALAARVRKRPATGEALEIEGLTELIPA